MDGEMKKVCDELELSFRQFIQELAATQGISESSAVFHMNTEAAMNCPLRQEGRGVPLDDGKDDKRSGSGVS